MEKQPRPPFTRRLRLWHLVAVDALLGLVVTYLVVGDSTRHRYITHLGVPVWTGVTLACLTGVAIAVRRLVPLTALAVATAASIPLALFDFSKQPDFQLVPLLYLVAVAKPTRVALGALVATMLGWFAAAGIAGYLPPLSPGRVPIDDFTVMLWLWAMPVASWTVGWALRSGRAYHEASRELAERQVQQERERADNVVTAERLRIAREVHDVVGHTLGVIAVQAGVGHYVADAQPDEAARSLAVIETISRAALMEMRALLGLLRDAGDVETLPAGLADLDTAIGQARRAGVAVDVVIGGPARTLSPGADLAAYRIVQEALTNVVRHAHTDRARVHIAYSNDAVAIEITDEGTGCRTESASTGHGLIGIRERVALHGGTFHAGPRSPRGFRVAARLPLHPSVTAPAVPAAEAAR